MTRSLEDTYQEVATAMAGAIAEPWDRAWIEVEWRGESSLALVGWHQAGDAPPRSFAVRGVLMRDLMLLHQRIRRDDASPWKKGVFRLSRDGDFRFDLEY